MHDKLTVKMYLATLEEIERLTGLKDKAATINIECAEGLDTPSVTLHDIPEQVWDILIAAAIARRDVAFAALRN